jgi:TetR/AcrR family transcriptional repressor of nem operon
VPRQRQFDPDTFLETAMLVFWERGYEGTSIRDIVERTGVNQFGIYRLYADKHELFLAVLDRYRDKIVESVFGIVEHPEASMGAIRLYFEILVKYHSTIMRAMGCLMANTMAESAESDADIRQRTQRHVARQRAGFSRALSNACRNGELSADINIPVMADFLVISVQGLAVYSRIYPDREPLERFVETTLSILTH